MMQRWECRCRRYSLVTAMLVIVACSLEAQSSRGSLAGTVTGPDGTVLGGVVVTYLLTPPPLGSSEPPGGGMATGPDGQFQFPNLRPGVYSLCAFAAPGLGFLDTCEWTRSPETATVTAGQASTGVPIVLQRGQRLHFRVNDPKQILANIATGLTGTSLVAGIWEPAGFYHTLPLRSFDASGQDLELAVPVAMPFHVSLAAGNAQITDSTGAAVLDQGAGLLLQIPIGTGLQQWNFTVQPAATVQPAP